MGYVVSRTILPESKPEMREELWFALWKRPMGLYRELIKGDRLYWYETTSAQIVWRTRVREVDRTVPRDTPDTDCAGDSRGSSSRGFLVSALQFGGKLKQLLDLAIDGQVDLAISEAVAA